MTGLLIIGLVAGALGTLASGSSIIDNKNEK